MRTTKELTVTNVTRTVDEIREVFEWKMDLIDFAGYQYEGHGCYIHDFDKPDGVLVVFQEDDEPLFKPVTPSQFYKFLICGQMEDKD